MTCDLQCRGDEMTVTLWGQQAHQFEDLKNEYQRPNIVLIVTGTKAVMYNGNIHFNNFCINYE